MKKEPNARSVERALDILNCYGKNQKYSLEPKIAQLGMLCFSNLDFRNIAEPYMVRLRDYYNESVS